MLQTVHAVSAPDDGASVSGKENQGYASQLAVQLTLKLSSKCASRQQVATPVKKAHLTTAVVGLMIKLTTAMVDLAMELTTAVAGVVQELTEAVADLVMDLTTAVAGWKWGQIEECSILEVRVSSLQGPKVVHSGIAASSIDSAVQRLCCSICTFVA